MRDVTADDFVVVDLPPLVDLIRSESATQADLTAALDAGEIDGRRRRGSIETLVHVAVQAVQPAAYIGHTHPTEVVGLLASSQAETAFARAAYSDEAVVIGRPLFVPYAQPGIDLGRLFFQRLVNHVERSGQLPQLVLLANHGIVAIAPTADGVEGLCEMAVKAAKVRRIAWSVGELTPLTDEAIDKFSVATTSSSAVATSPGDGCEPADTAAGGLPRRRWADLRRRELRRPRCGWPWRRCARTTAARRSTRRSSAHLRPHP
jgi:ribulose-5-phosphate 4-epimerase/fuculose-1-phosphate aldolase